MGLIFIIPGFFILDKYFNFLMARNMPVSMAGLWIKMTGFYFQPYF
jgi:hypothetical protein